MARKTKEERKKEEEDKEWEMQMHERNARFRAAWGRYAAMMRQSEHDTSRAELEHSLRHSSSDERRKKLKEFDEEAIRKNSGRLYIG